MTPPTASFVVPTLNEVDYLPATLRSIRALETDVDYEVVVADGGSTDGTRPLAREHGACVVVTQSRGIAVGRNAGARAADGEWLAFVDADTAVRADYLDRMLAFVRRSGVAGASSRCRVTDCYRGKAMQAFVNHLFPLFERPVLPGFNTFVRRSAFETVGGYPTVGNEDTAFSRALGREFDTEYCPDVLVETSGRRFVEQGLAGAAAHYLSLDVQRVRAT
ncbi:glycosyltransferase [Halobacterium wangiae]|uniref:glycosyltransferase n=1 Tax=Halobacterium wangiae TaxID=2902623 RepID=UPI001E3407A6|nr:glycosyltransferase [Halobacterium wangiae]